MYLFAYRQGAIEEVGFVPLPEGIGRMHDLRAIETGRALVNISTVGTSAVVMPDGSDLARLDTFTADAMVTEVPLVRGETPALRLGAFLAGIWITFAVGGTLLSVWGGNATRIGGSRRKAGESTTLASVS